MRDNARIDHILEQLRILWHLNPDQRLGQLIANTASKSGTYTHDPLYQIRLMEDEHWSRAITDYTLESKR